MGASIEFFKEKLNEFVDFKELTAPMVNQLIERIEVFHRENDNGKEIRRIKITYRFIGTF